ncbi:MAG: Type 1 glutamine amidotransferase-like domain-containing protein [Candidatus Moraniibacteriota bacterium]
MLLFLTSIAAKTIHKILPYLPKQAHEMRIAFIPTASDIYTPHPWIEDDRNKLMELGFQVEDIDIKEFSTENLQKKLSDVDIIFVAGGNTSYLLEQTQKNGFLEITRNLVHLGTIYIGSSAGSLLAAPNIEVDKIYDDGEFGKELASYEGLGLINFVPLPHADNPKYLPYLERAFKEYGDKYKLVRLNDNQVIVVTEGETEMLDA